MPNPVMGAEDFSYVLQRVPGAMMFLGGTPRTATRATAAPNHSNRVVFDEDGDDVGIAMYATAASHRADLTPAAPPRRLRHVATACIDESGRAAVERSASAARRRVTISNGRSVSATMPSPTSIAGVGSSSRLHASGLDGRSAGCTVDRDRLPHGLVQAHDQVALPSSASLTASTSTPPVRSTLDDRGTAMPSRAPSPPSTTRSGTFKRRGLVDDIVRPGAVRVDRQGRPCARPWSAAGSGYSPRAPG